MCINVLYLYICALNMYTHIYNILVQRHQEVCCLMATIERAPFIYLLLFTTACI